MATPSLAAASFRLQDVVDPSHHLYAYYKNIVSRAFDGTIAEYEWHVLPTNVLSQIPKELRQSCPIRVRRPTYEKLVQLLHDAGYRVNYKAHPTYEELLQLLADVGVFMHDRVRRLRVEAKESNKKRAREARLFVKRVLLHRHRFANGPSRLSREFKPEESVEHAEEMEETPAA